ncbi:phosphonate ABC transporter, permease protein PhnE [Plastoroseomonas hellenica]
MSVTGADTAAWRSARPAVIRGEEAFHAARRSRRRATLFAMAVLALCLLVSAWMSEAHPVRLAEGLPRIGEYFARILPTLHWSTLFAGTETEGSLAFWFYRIDDWLLLLAETANMAAVATLGGIVAALPLAFLAARNTAPTPWTATLARRFLEALRTVPSVVYALIFVWAFGVGALAGVLAIALHTTGALGKLFAEAIENGDHRPWDGMVAAGANWMECCRFGALPQALPSILSYSLLRFEENLRSASVIGFVGAGGIGEELYKVISFNYYEEISAIIVLIMLAVMAIDLTSEQIRHRLAGAL